MNELNECQCLILEYLSDGDEPFESIDKMVLEINSSYSADYTRQMLFDLYKCDFIEIRQIPINPLGQSFIEKQLMPKNVEELMGDVVSFYYEYKLKRDYLWEFDAGNKGIPAGIPFGIWIARTEKGTEEYNKDIYNKYWANEN